MTTTTLDDLMASVHWVVQPSPAELVAAAPPVKAPRVTGVKIEELLKYGRRGSALVVDHDDDAALVRVETDARKVAESPAFVVLLTWERAQAQCRPPKPRDGEAVVLPIKPAAVGRSLTAQFADEWAAA